MDDWKQFNEILLPDNEDFYSHLNMKDIMICMFRTIHY